GPGRWVARGGAGRDGPRPPGLRGRLRQRPAGHVPHRDRAVPLPDRCRHHRDADRVGRAHARRGAVRPSPAPALAAARRQRADARHRAGLRGRHRFLAPAGRRRPRDAQPLGRRRQRLPADRAGLPGRLGRRRPADLPLRPIQPGRRHRRRARRAGLGWAGAAQPSPRMGSAIDTASRLPGLCRHRRGGRPRVPGPATARRRRRTGQRGGTQPAAAGVEAHGVRAGRAVQPRFSRQRLRRAVVAGAVAAPALRPVHRHDRHRLLRRRLVGRCLAAAGRAPCGEDRADPHHGLHPPSGQRPVVGGRLRFPGRPRHRPVAGTCPVLADGRARPAGLRHGSGDPGRAGGGGQRHQRAAQPGLCHHPAAGRSPAGAHQLRLAPGDRRRRQDRLRPVVARPLPQRARRDRRAPPRASAGL
ncbi:MAG: Uncharacterized MFS-type transporter, partial [uncultured Acidimicrobiales bacterium]